MPKTGREPRSRRWSILAAIVPLSLAMGACDSATGATDVSSIEWSSSFGFCPPTAYCTTRLHITGRQAVLTLESRESATVRIEEQLGAAEANSLAEAAARAQFDGLPPVMGCPDCADGGAETLTVVTEDGERSVTFEYNAPLDALEPLLGRMRSLTERLRPDEGP
jgi:hypothetical protein